MSIYYWHNKNEQGNTLKEELLNYNKVRSIKIATAYLSKDGLDIIKELKEKYRLDTSSIEVYISPEFSVQDPDKLLEELIKICKVYMVFKNRFHSKVYLLQRCNESKLIFGSSNLTNGGFSNNIEFDSIEYIDDKNEMKVSMFFTYCKNNSRIVDCEIINFYKKQKDIFKNLNDNRINLRREMYKFQNMDDAFDEDKYNLKNKYFNYDDYETLFIKNQKLNSIDVRKRREIIKEKIIDINDTIYEEIKNLNLYHHWRKENITSLIVPCVYNNYKVNWIGARYGKNKKEIDTLNQSSLGKNDEYSFQKHACLQYCITPYGFEINLFHAVRNGAVDRRYLQQNIKELNCRIINELRKLKGENCIWYITDEENNKTYTFNINEEKCEDFIDFYNKYDKEGRESCLTYYIEPDDKLLDNKKTLSEFILKKFKKLVPLYNLLAFRPIK